jgi:hypothetical protein
VGKGALLTPFLLLVVGLGFVAARVALRAANDGDVATAP